MESLQDAYLITRAKFVMKERRKKKKISERLEGNKSKYNKKKIRNNFQNLQAGHPNHLTNQVF